MRVASMVTWMTLPAAAMLSAALWAAETGGGRGGGGLAAGAVGTAGNCSPAGGMHSLGFCLQPLVAESRLWE